MNSFLYLGCKNDSSENYEETVTIGKRAESTKLKECGNISFSKSEFVQAVLDQQCYK